MENIIDVLKSMEKASAREIAARMNLEPREALDMLRKHEEVGEVRGLNGYWQLSGKPASSYSKCPYEAPKKVRFDVDEMANKVSRLLRDKGSMTCADIGKALGRDSRGMISTLMMLERENHIISHRTDKQILWSLPEEVAKKEVAAVIETIPSFVIHGTTETFSDMLKAVNREIRYTREKGTRLEELRDGIRLVRKHANTLEEVMAWKNW
ncbi:hypothetical protein LN032_03925 [Klebsiella pneumoniae]|nr:hypothetical protein [Klebsiella pneumoniae]